MYVGLYMYVFCTFLNNLENANHEVTVFSFFFCVRVSMCAHAAKYLKNAYCMVVLFNLNHNISYRIYNNFSI